MNKNLNILTLPFPIILIFIWISSATPSLHLRTHNNSPTRQLFGAILPESEPIILEKVGPNIILTVTLKDDGSLGVWDSNPVSQNIVMALALYTSQSILSNSCLQFLGYDSSENSLASSSQSPLTFPYFQVESYSTSDIYINTIGWNISNTVTMASSCGSDGYASYGSGIYGLIGMGIENQYQGNLPNVPIFSIYLEEDSSSGEIMLGAYFSYTDINSRAAVLTADSNWHVYGVSNIQIGSYSSSVDMNLIFDINADAIGFPVDIFQAIVASIAADMSITCSTDLYLPTCQYVGGVKDFPVLQISIGTQIISIPPSVYVLEGYEQMAFLGSITLNLRALGTNLTDQSYVTPEYSNYIILDDHAMSFYYTVFDASAGNQISLYVVDRTDYVTIYILVGNGGLLLVFGACYCISNYYARKSPEEEEPEDSNKKPKEKEKEEDQSKKRLLAKRKVGFVAAETSSRDAAEPQNVEDSDRSRIISGNSLTQSSNKSDNNGVEPQSKKEVELTAIRALE